MPIEVAAQIRLLDQREFHAINSRVLGIVFDIHNEFGRLLDEALFKSEIAARCEAVGIVPAQREVRIAVTHGGFMKGYSLDLLLSGGLLIEAKAAQTIVRAHTAQSLNYLLLAGMQHGTLINLRPEQVQHRFISTQLTPKRRRQFNIVDMGWRVEQEGSRSLKGKMIALLEDWGAFLEAGLYRDALTHFMGGAEKVVQLVPIYSGSRLVGHQRMHLLDPDTAFSLTTVTKDRHSLETHQRRFLSHTNLHSLHWINLNHHEIEFSTLLNSPKGRNGKKAGAK